MGEEGFGTHTDLEKRIGEVFDVFDHAGNKSVDVREIGTIIRALGCCPSEQDVQDLIAQVEDEEASGSVEFGKFLPIVAELIRENKMQPADPEMLLKAFLVLDEQKKGYVTKEELTKALMEEGEQFTQEEIDEMLTVAVDSESGIIPYEYFLNQLMMSKDIYKLAQQELEKAKLDKKGHGKERRSTVANLAKTLDASRKSNEASPDGGTPSGPPQSAPLSPTEGGQGPADTAPTSPPGPVGSPSKSPPENIPRNSEALMGFP